PGLGFGIDRCFRVVATPTSGRRRAAFVSKDVSLAVVTAVLGLLTAGVLALINNWINIRAGVDENLRSRRLDQYPALWLATAVVSRWPREVVSRGLLDDLLRWLSTWYSERGSIFLSDQ